MLRGPSVTLRRLAASILSAVSVVLVAIAAIPEPASANDIEALSWSHDRSGNTVVTVALSEVPDLATIRSYHIAGPPRAVMVIEGVTRTLDPRELTIGNRYVKRARLVLHTDRDPTELLVVLDLTTPDAGLLELRPSGRSLEMVVGPVVGTDPSPAPTASATATAVPSPTPTPTASPPPPTATPTPSSTPPPTPTPEPPPPPAPKPTSPPRPTAAPTAHSGGQPGARDLEPGFPPDAPPPVLPRPSPVTDPDAPASHLVEIAATPRGDGSTLLRATADGRLPAGCARTLRVAGDRTRVVLTLRGISAPDLPRTMDFDDPNLTRLRLVHDAEINEGELHLVLQLARPGVTVGDPTQLGPHLVVVLYPDETATNEP